MIWPIGIRILFFLVRLLKKAGNPKGQITINNPQYESKTIDSIDCDVKLQNTEMRNKNRIDDSSLP